MTELPIDPLLPEIIRTLLAKRRLVLEAPPGAGKTTRVPPALIEHLPGTVVVLEPRRIAARASAQRVAAELGESVGDRIGYRVRFDSRISASTRVEYVTEGVFIRRLARDPALKDVSCVVFDEFHERHIDSDLALALCAQRSDLHLLVMSATLDAGPIADHLGAPRLRAQGRTFPVEIEYINDERPLPQQVARALRGSDGDALVFLPGVGEIGRCANALSSWDIDVLPLHGQLPASEHARVFTPSKRRRVILATNVAETSITVEGVTLVVDSGLARIPTWDPATGLQRLSLAPISRASAEQRAGRAGRTAPGRCVRLYSKTDFTHRREHTPPEIQRADSTALLLTILGLSESPDTLHWLTPPLASSLAQARALLRRLGAIDGDRITEFGQRLCQLPLHPRLGALLVLAAQAGHRRLGAEAAAMLSERDFVPREDAVTIATSDLQWRSELLNTQGVGHRPTAKRIRLAAQDLERRVESEPVDPLEFDRAVFRAYSDRLAKTVTEKEVLFASGGRATLDSGSVVRDNQWLVALESEKRGHRGREKTYVLRASAVEPSWIEEDLADEIVAVEEWELSDGRVFIDEGFKIGELWLEHVRTPARAGPQTSEALREHLSKRGIRAVFPENEIDNVVARISLAGLDATEDRLLATACEGETQVSGVRSKSLAEVVYALVPEIDHLAPKTLKLPSGRELPVHYAKGRAPWVESYLQDFFGMAKTPKVVDTPVTIHLWAPNRRALQVTTDLASFWANTYPELKRSLSRRYPKHVWPDDPATAAPTRLKRHRRNPA